MLDVDASLLLILDHAREEQPFIDAGRYGHVVAYAHVAAVLSAHHDVVIVPDTMKAGCTTCWTREKVFERIVCVAGSIGSREASE